MASLLVPRAAIAALTPLVAAMALAGCGKSGEESPPPPAATCSDGVRNGAEADVDCGGACPACGAGRTCAATRDCQSGVCAGTCQAAICTDGVKNGAETDVDCGGGACPTCAAGGACSLAADCASFACDATCQASPSCGDGTKNGLESDVDCGGAICAPCTAGGACVKPFDCDTLLCSGGACQALGSTCGNGVTDGTETDVDCGGGACGTCRDGAACAAGVDCRSGACTAGLTCCRNTVTLTWDAPQTTVGGGCVTTLAGFKVYFGTASGSYGAPVDLPLGSPLMACAQSGASGTCGPIVSCTHTLTLTTPETWYFATTAYDRSGGESAKSSEVSKRMFPCP